MLTKPFGLKIRAGEKGTILIMVLLLMAVMSIIGVTASMVTRTEIGISVNNKISRIAFYTAESGVEVSPKIIRGLIDEGVVATVNGLSVDPGLMSEIMGFTTELDINDSVYAGEKGPDLKMSIGPNTFITDIDRDAQGARHIVGGGVQFASGAEGVGAGSAGGVLIYYDIDSVGTTPTEAKSFIDARYRKVVGTAGGK